MWRAGTRTELHPLPAPEGKPGAKSHPTTLQRSVWLWYNCDEGLKVSRGADIFPCILPAPSPAALGGQHSWSYSLAAQSWGWEGDPRSRTPSANPLEHCTPPTPCRATSISPACTNQDLDLHEVTSWSSLGPHRGDILLSRPTQQSQPGSSLPKYTFIHSVNPPAITLKNNLTATQKSICGQRAARKQADGTPHPLRNRGTLELHVQPALGSLPQRGTHSVLPSRDRDCVHEQDGCSGNHSSHNISYLCLSPALRPSHSRLSGSGGVVLS